jgi:hypothetical protein
MLRIYIEHGYYDTDETTNVNDYITDIHAINHFTDFFNPIHDDIEPDMLYEITYHNRGHLSCDQLEKLIKDIIFVNDKHQVTLNMIIKIFDGLFLTYWIINNNIITDLTTNINAFMKKCDKKYKNPLDF